MRTVIKSYAYLHEFFHKVFKVNIPGLGYLYRQINNDFYLDVKGHKMFFNHKAADNYGRLINGRFNEPETHFFLDHVFSKSPGKPFHFIEVGGNIGEFVLDYGTNPDVAKVTVFEPQPAQSDAISKTILVNNLKHVELIKKPVSNAVEEILFNFNPINASASGISNNNVGTPIMATTLDTVIEIGDYDYVMLVDVEGAELKVFEGGTELIKSKLPLIIFEYNHVTRKAFSLEEANQQLGDGYTIYRLRQDGKLDQDFSRTWNLVAVPNENDSFSHIKSQIVNSAVMA